MEKLQEGERAIVIGINGDLPFRKYLMNYGLSLGTVFTKNFSPKYAQLINLSVGTKMLCLRYADFKKLEWIRI